MRRSSEYIFFKDELSEILDISGERRKTIYEYNKFDLDEVDIKNDTLIYITPRPTCLHHTNCEACVKPTEHMSYVSKTKCMNYKLHYFK